MAESYTKKKNIQHEYIQHEYESQTEKKIRVSMGA